MLDFVLLASDFGGVIELSDSLSDVQVFDNAKGDCHFPDDSPLCTQNPSEFFGGFFYIWSDGYYFL